MKPDTKRCRLIKTLIKFHMEKVTPESDAVHTEKYCKVLSGLTKKIK